LSSNFITIDNSIFNSYFSNIVGAAVTNIQHYIPSTSGVSKLDYYYGAPYYAASIKSSDKTVFTGTYKRVPLIAIIA